MFVPVRNYFRSSFFEEELAPSLPSTYSDQRRSTLHSHSQSSTNWKNIAQQASYKGIFVLATLGFFLSEMAVAETIYSSTVSS